MSKVAKTKSPAGSGPDQAKGAEQVEQRSHAETPREASAGTNQWNPDAMPTEEYPLTRPHPPPLSVSGGPVRFPESGEHEMAGSEFPDFVWDIVNAMDRLNTGLYHYRVGRANGLDASEARRLYDMAVRNYADLRIKWGAEMRDPYTWIQPAITVDGYITEVLVRSRAFSLETPGQSESRNSTNPPGSG
ncbi:MAG: hypothetical protein KF833_00600 [Verrucomicrobiae bacterium]|nr:hypothetical protein [Verrucomicrobiae bacterium]